MIYSVPYGKGRLSFDTRGRAVIFTGEMRPVPAVSDFKNALLKALSAPIGSMPLSALAKGKKNILFLVEDNTRETPLSEILPIVAEYLLSSGVEKNALSFLTAPGTHRLMTGSEVRGKLGDYIVDNFPVFQHDASDEASLTDLGEIEGVGYPLPVRINSRALSADLLIGVGNITPHSDAGFSGGAKIVQPGICDFVTTQATHRAAGLYPDIPLGVLEGNPCRDGIDAVGAAAKLGFIINIVKNYSGDVAGFFCGDYSKAHRAGVELAKEAYSVRISELADIVVASSSPADMDYWQGIKGLTAAYFAVKKGGAVILAAPCHEGLVHNHPLYAHWLAQPAEALEEVIRSASPYDLDTDVISAVVALGSRRVLNKAEVYMVSGGLSDSDISAMGYTPCPDIQTAFDMALSKRTGATVGILPCAGISLPLLCH